MRSISVFALVIASLLCATADVLAAAAPASALPPIKHVFVIVVENKDYDQNFGPASQAPYLAKELTRQGQLLTHYYGTSHASLGNYISMVSGIASNPDTQGDCAHGFNDVFPGIPSPDGQVIGVGCVYPPQVKTIADQLDAAGRTWKGYMEDMGNTPSAPKTCRHPASGAIDDTQSARATDQYATRHNPFVYFHSIIDDKARCNARVVPLDRLTADLGAVETTPNLSFITPDLCSDAHDEPCIDGRPGGLKSTDAFLREWVPRITGSPAYGEGGVLIITWDEGNVGAGTSDACCSEPSGPNTVQPGIFGAGGGRTGTLVLSPFTRAGSVNDQSYNHYALLRSIEDIFGLGHLGYAGAGGLKAFGSDVFNQPFANAVQAADAGQGPDPGAGQVADADQASGAGEAPVAGQVAGCRAASLPRATRGRLPRGAILRDVSVVRSGGRATLDFAAAHAASLRITVGRRTSAVRRLRACRQYHVALRGRHRHVELRAQSGRAVETRSLRY